MAVRKSDLPFAGDFSPSEIELSEVLAFAQGHDGDRKALEDAIRRRYYDPRTTTKEAQKPKLAYNVALGMQKYGLIDEGAHLTALGAELLSLAHDDGALHTRFARHILIDLPGSTLLECIRDMRSGGEKIDLVRIRRALLDRDVHTPTATKHISLMRLWLDKAHVTTPAWAINESVYREIVGLPEATIAALATLSREQRAVLTVLAEIGTTVDSSMLRMSTEKAQAISLNEKTFPKVLRPLADLGFLTFTAAGGRSAPVTPTEKLTADVVVPLIEQYAHALPAGLRALLRRPLADVVSALDSKSGHEKGLALEALGFKIMRSIGLDYRATRFRPTSGGRFEVDLLFDSQRLAYSRWQIQCKNTSRVDLDDVAKEVGLVYRLLSNVIVVLTRGSVGVEARRFAVDVMQKANLAIVLIDGEDVAQIVGDPLAIYEILDREASFALSVKPVDSDVAA